MTASSREPEPSEPFAEIATSASAEGLEQAHRLLAFWQALFQLTPRVWVTPLIVGLNVLVFAAMVARGVDPLRPNGMDMIAWGADHGPLTLEGQWWRLLSATFLHWGVIHLGINMWVLWDAGRLVERLVGNFGFLVLYLASGIWGNLASLAWNPDVISAGASGSVFGVWGALAAFYARKSAALPPEVVFSLKKSIGPFLLYNLVIGMFMPGIDQAAHLGGLAGGFVLGCLMAQPIRPEAKAGRLRRNLLALIAAGAVTALGIAALPGFAQSATLVLTRFGKVEQEVLDEWIASGKALEGGQITEAEYARRLRDDILPRWRDAAVDLAAFKPRRAELQEYLSKLVRYARLRQEAWELSAEAIEHQDQAMFMQATEKHQTAGRLAQEIARGGKK